MFGGRRPYLDGWVRAVVQNANAVFATRMRLKGHTKEIVAAKPRALTSTTVKEIPQKLTETEAVEWVKDILLRSRGRELPDTYNPMVINTIFQEQSQQWEIEVRKHVEHVWRACKRLMTSIICETDTELPFLSLIDIVAPAKNDVTFPFTSQLFIKMENSCNLKPSTKYTINHPFLLVSYKNSIKEKVMDWVGLGLFDD